MPSSKKKGGAERLATIAALASQHQERPPGNACLACYTSKLRCDRGTPCARCHRLGLVCLPHQRKPRSKSGSKKKLLEEEQRQPSAGDPVDVGPPQQHLDTSNHEYDMDVDLDMDDCSTEASSNCHQGGSPAFPTHAPSGGGSTCAPAAGGHHPCNRVASMGLRWPGMPSLPLATVAQEYKRDATRLWAAATQVQFHGPSPLELTISCERSTGDGLESGPPSNRPPSPFSAFLATLDGDTEACTLPTSWAVSPGTTAAALMFDGLHDIGDRATPTLELPPSVYCHSDDNHRGAHCSSSSTSSSSSSTSDDCNSHSTTVVTSHRHSTTTLHTAIVTHTTTHPCPPSPPALQQLLSSSSSSLSSTSSSATLAAPSLIPFDPQDRPSSTSSSSSSSTQCPNGLVSPQPEDLATLLLNAHRQGRLLPHKTKAILTSWHLWSVWQQRDVSNGLLRAVSSGLATQGLDLSRLSLPPPPPLNPQQLHRGQEMLLKRLEPLWSLGADTAVCVVLMCGGQVSVQASARFEQVFMSKSTLEEGILVDGSLPQHLWARMMKDQRSVDMYWALMLQSTFQSDPCETPTSHPMTVCDRFGVRSWELCTLGCHASDDGCFSTSWIILQPIISQPSPPAPTPVVSQSAPLASPPAVPSPAHTHTSNSSNSNTHSPQSMGPSSMGPLPAVQPPTRPAVRIPTMVA